MEALDLDAYFERVGYDGPASATLQTLSRLHALHAAAIAFENLSPLLGEPVALDLAALQDKLIARRRGGWCFEQNLLFAHVLERIGFRLARLGARVRWNVPPGVTSSRSHCLLLVDVEGRDHVADVGFGGLTLTAPLRLEAGVEQATPHETHRFVKIEGGFLLEARVAGDWQSLYSFDLQPQLLADYEVSNWYLCHHPRSIFLNGLVAARAMPDARHALRDARYAIYRPDGSSEKRRVASVAQMRELLAGAFGIELPQNPALDGKLAECLRKEAK